jgi:hypothetical protein
MDPSDALEKRIRFIFGFVFGFFLGVAISLRLLPWDAWVIIAVTVASALGCGVLASMYGDRFWVALTGRRWW